MPEKKHARLWLIVFFCTAFVLALAIASFNFITDPFGVFGDRFFDWYAFNMTQNPRVAKIVYMDKNYEEFNGFIFGSSGSSSYSAVQVGGYEDAEFYNLFVYGADMYDTKLMIQYAFEQYNVEHIVLNMNLMNAHKYDTPKTDVTKYLHANADGSSKATFYANYLFANPNYGISKIEDYRNNNPYLQEIFDVFDVETGSYDKTSRDVDRISDMASYLEQHPEFSTYVTSPKPLIYLDECIAALREIKDTADAHGAKLTVIFPPIYAADIQAFDLAELEELFTRTAEITDFWDFSVSSISNDARYFYDLTHFRNDIGRMMLAKIYGDDSIYVPSDIGELVTLDNGAIARRLQTFETAADSNPADYTTRVPILMYHHLAETSINADTISSALFDQHMNALQDNGYTTVTFEQLLAYTQSGTPLPEKPVVITFDDGYASNYEIAYPILKQYGMKATIFAIGATFGSDTYKDSGDPIFPHFGAEELREMTESGVIFVQTHTFDMHQAEAFEDPQSFRRGVLRLDGESDKEYAQAFWNDIMRSQQQLSSVSGEEVFVLAYPHGLYTTESEVLANACGISITVTSEPGINTVICGLPQSLRAMKRLTIDESKSAQDLITLLETAS